MGSPKLAGVKAPTFRARKRLIDGVHGEATSRCDVRVTSNLPLTLPSRVLYTFSSWTALCSLLMLHPQAMMACAMVVATMRFGGHCHTSRIAGAAV